MCAVGAISVVSHYLIFSNASLPFECYITAKKVFVKFCCILISFIYIVVCQMACQDQDDDEDEQQAEYDGMLIETAGDVLPVMARLMGGEAFLPFFSSFITDLLKGLVKF